MSLAVRCCWTEEEDSAVRTLVQEHGTSNWTNISKLLSNRYLITRRSGKQCRERWNNHLKPCVDKKDWSEAEDAQIFELYKQYGNSWMSIASQIPGRTDNSVKNRFYTTMRRKLRKFNKARPYSKRFIGSVRTLLRNPTIINQILNEDAPSRKSKKSEPALPTSFPIPIIRTPLPHTNPEIIPLPSPITPTEPVEDASLLFNLSDPGLSYFFFYPKAILNYTSKREISLPSNNK